MIVNATAVPAPDGIPVELNTWQRVKNILREQGMDYNFYTCYLRDTEQVEHENGRLVVGVETQFKREWLVDRVGNKASRIASGVVGHNTVVEFILYERMGM